MRIFLAEREMNFWSTPWSRNESNPSKKWLTFKSPMGLAWRLILAQEIKQKICSSVPKPLGRAMKASDWQILQAMCSDIEVVLISWPCVILEMYGSAKGIGITPTTKDFARYAACETHLFNPQLPPPYTKLIFCSLNLGQVRLLQVHNNYCSWVESHIVHIWYWFDEPFMFVLYVCPEKRFGDQK